MITLVHERATDTQPTTDDPEKLVDHDLGFLLEHLRVERGTGYELVDRPDRTERTARAPDYLVREVATGRTLAVERKQLLSPIRQARRARAIRRGSDAILEGPTTWEPQAACAQLREQVTRILARGQLHGVDADERILLLRNRLDATAKTFLQARGCLADVDPGGIDHAYLICTRSLLRLW